MLFTALRWLLTCIRCSDSAPEEVFFSWSSLPSWIPSAAGKSRAFLGRIDTIARRIVPGETLTA